MESWTLTQGELDPLPRESWTLTQEELDPLPKGCLISYPRGVGSLVQGESDILPKGARYITQGELDPIPERHWIHLDISARGCLIRSTENDVVTTVLTTHCNPDQKTRVRIERITFGESCINVNCMCELDVPCSSDA